MLTPHATYFCTVMHQLTTGMRSEKGVVRLFHRCGNITERICTKPDGTARDTAGLRGTDLMGPPSSMWSVVDRNVVMQRMTIRLD